MRKQIGGTEVSRQRLGEEERARFTPLSTSQDGGLAAGVAEPLVASGWRDLTREGSSQPVLLWGQPETDASRANPQVCKSDGLSVWQVSAGPRETKLESPERVNVSLYSCRKTLRDSPQAGGLPTAALCRWGGSL